MILLGKMETKFLKRSYSIRKKTPLDPNEKSTGRKKLRLICHFPWTCVPMLFGYTPRKLPQPKLSYVTPWERTMSRTKRGPWSPGRPSSASKAASRPQGEGDEATTQRQVGRAWPGDHHHERLLGHPEPGQQDQRHLQGTDPLQGRPLHHRLGQCHRGARQSKELWYWRLSHR